MHLIALAWTDLTELTFWWNVLQVCVGVGMVIFVHELGHFAVAKMCGVKCEKFYLGFDIFGLKICKRWGETEYGIGILPLGGYVKMLGQDDNPARAAAEAERARLHAETLTAAGDKVQTGRVQTENATPTDGSSETTVLDPRSYMAQSVPERMAIISAGVIMNVIFAFVVSMIAYGMGVKYNPAVLGTVAPGAAAWRAGLRPGDKIVRIGRFEKPRFQDVMVAIALDDIQDGIDLTVERPGVEKLLKFNVTPLVEGIKPMIGIGPSAELTLQEKMPIADYSPVAGELAGGEEIMAIDGVEVETYAELQRELARKPDRAIEVTLQLPATDDGETPPTRVVAVPPVPMRQLGIVMKLGAITAVQPDSPAQENGLKPGDEILSIDGEPPVDPMFLAEWLRRKAGSRIDFLVKRAGEADPIAIDGVKLREPTTIDGSSEGGAMSAPALGITCAVENEVASIEPGSPADGKVSSGDRIMGATLIPPEGKANEKAKQKEFTLKFNEKLRSWPALFTVLQEMVPGTKVALTLDKDRTVELEPVAAGDWNNPDRGFIPQPLMHTRTAESLSEAASLAGRDTLEYLTQVFKFIRRIFGGQVSLKLAGGPVSIVEAAYNYADLGFPELLTFLAMLSANLAVINFLPIPVLDGGHMVFLMYEGVRRRPPSERIVVAFTYAGLFLILSLMVFVLALDVGLIARR